MTTDNPVEQQSTTSGGVAAELELEATHAAAGTSPWALAWRRLKRNKVSLAFGVLFIVLVLCALAAPIWAEQVAETTPSRNNVEGQITKDGEQVDVVSLEGVPIGPTWQGKYFLGADSNGRDVMVRLLYGARNSLFIGITAALITMLFAVILGVTAGYFRGWTDSLI
jgi:peptide/nickel transport system permease protein